MQIEPLEPALNPRRTRRRFLRDTAVLAAWPVLFSAATAAERASTQPSATQPKPASMRIGFHTDAFNSAYWSFEKCLQWAQKNNVHYIECGLIDGVSWIHEFRQAASYVDSILRGANPADLPVQAATKFVTVLTVRTAQALGLTISPTLLAQADEVIE